MGYYQGDYYAGDYRAGGLPALAGIGIGVLRKAVPKLGGAIGRTIGKTIGRGKAGRVLKSGVKIGAGGAVFEAGSRVVRGRGGSAEGMPARRRMNVGNAKALRRAIRRAHGFAKLARSVMTFPISCPPKGRPLFKKAGRRR